MSLKKSEIKKLMQEQPAAAVKLIAVALRARDIVPASMHKRIDMEDAIGNRGCNLFIKLIQAGDDFAAPINET